MDILEELEIMEIGEPQIPVSSPPPKPSGLRPEILMSFLALLCAAFVGVLLLMTPEDGAIPDDPESPKLKSPIQAAQMPAALTPVDPLESEMESTIPPDPNPFDHNDFQYNHRNYLLLQNLPSAAGVDVSAWQGEINWEKVKASGIEFAFIRLGVRGYESGKISEDAYGNANLDGAAAAGLKIGAYFFSQAISIKEVDQEIDFILKMLEGRTLDLPIVLDWEIPAANARTAKMDRRTLTDMQKHFIARMQEEGLEPLVYFTPHQSQNLYYLNELEDASFWLAHYQDRMTFPWKVEYWQYTDKGRVPGIDGPVDMNVYMPD